MKKPIHAAQVTAPDELLKFMLVQWPAVKRTKLKDWLKEKSVHINGVATSQFNHPLNPGDRVSVEPGRGAPELPAGMQLIFEDDAILVIDKPAGLLSMASASEREQTAYALINAYTRVLIVHRLDRETSGLMVFAKTAEAQRTLERNWSDTEKVYWAVTEGAPTASEGTLRSHLDESHVHKVFSAPPSELTREAITHYRVLKRAGAYALIELRLETGRRHQIRVHLSDLGRPCVGDEKYGARTDPARRLGLHAHRLSFSHPLTSERMSFESPLPVPLARAVKL